MQSSSVNPNNYPEVVRVVGPMPGTPKMSVGSGTIIKNTKSKGITILTNAHVIAQSPIVKIQPMFAMHKSYPVKVAGVCYDRDVALLHANEETSKEMLADIQKYGYKTIPYMELGSMNMVNIHGSDILAVGYPLGMPNQQVSNGITRGWYTTNTGEEMLMVGCAINEGNSGGALLYNDGKKNFLIGIPTAKLAGQNIENEGMVKNIDSVKAILPALMTNVSEPKVQYLSPAMLQQLMKAFQSQGVGLGNPQAAGFKESHASWLIDNCSVFLSTWREQAVGGLVGGEPRTFSGWFQRHVYSNEHFLKGGIELLHNVIDSVKNDTVASLIRERNKSGGWKKYRESNCNAGIVPPNQGGVQIQTQQLTHLVHSPRVFGQSHAVKTNDMFHYYGANPDNHVGGVILTHMNHNSLFSQAGGKVNDIIYAIKYDNNKWMELNMNGTYEKDNLGVTHSLKGLTNLIPLGSSMSVKVIRRCVSSEPEYKEINFKMREPTHDELPHVHMVHPFNDTSNEVQTGCEILGMKMSPLKMNHVQQFSLIDYMKEENRNEFRVVVTDVHPNSPAWGIIPQGSLVEKLNGVEPPNNFKEFIEKVQKVDETTKCWHLQTSRNGVYTSYAKKLN